MRTVPLHQGAGLQVSGTEGAAVGHNLKKKKNLTHPNLQTLIHRSLETEAQKNKRKSGRISRVPKLILMKTFQDLLSLQCNKHPKKFILSLSHSVSSYLPGRASDMNACAFRMKNIYMHTVQ